VLEPVGLYFCERAISAAFEESDSYVAEDDLGQRSTYSLVNSWPYLKTLIKSLTTTGIVDDLLHDAANVTIALSLC
jgi:hypothetical protein